MKKTNILFSIIFATILFYGTIYQRWIHNNPTPEDFIHTVNVDASTGPVTITLPSLNYAKTYRITKVDNTDSEVLVRVPGSYKFKRIAVE